MSLIFLVSARYDSKLTPPPYHLRRHVNCSFVDNVGYPGTSSSYTIPLSSAAGRSLASKTVTSSHEPSCGRGSGFRLKPSTRSIPLLGSFLPQGVSMSCVGGIGVFFEPTLTDAPIGERRLKKASVSVVSVGSKSADTNRPLFFFGSNMTALCPARTA